MRQQQLEVAKWMRAFGQETPACPGLPKLSVLNLRAKLIEEEGLTETVDALREPLCEMTKVLDGLADSLFVILGTAVAFGVDIEPIFNEVVRSNWTKFWTAAEIDGQRSTLEAASLTIERVTLGFRCFLVKRPDGKVIKSPSFSQPDFTAILRERKVPRG